MTKSIQIKLMGAIKTDWGTKTLKYPILDSTHEITLKKVLNQLSQRFQDNFGNHFETDLTPKRGTIILVNGVDFQVQDGLETILKPNDELTFVPTISGG